MILKIWTRQMAMLPTCSKKTQEMKQFSSKRNAKSQRPNPNKKLLKMVQTRKMRSIFNLLKRFLNPSPPMYFSSKPCAKSRKRMVHSSSNKLISNSSLQTSFQMLASNGPSWRQRRSGNIRTRPLCRSRDTWITGGRCRSTSRDSDKGSVMERKDKHSTIIIPLRRRKSFNSKEVSDSLRL